MKRTKRPTALVDLDYYRFSFTNPPREDHNLEYEMSGNDVLIGLKLGFDVIFDGNFTATAHDPFLEKLFHTHPEENYLFYLDSIEKMREVYEYASPTGREEEVVIPESSSLEQTVEQIARITGIYGQPTFTSPSAPSTEP